VLDKEQESLNKTKLLKEQEKKLRGIIKKNLQSLEKKLEVIDEKIKNKDYKEYNGSNHDKMILQNRKMILESKISMLELRDYCLDLDVAFTDHVDANTSIIREIITVISQDSGMSSSNKEKVISLLNKLKPKKLTINTGIVKAEWYDDSKSNS